MSRDPCVVHTQPLAVEPERSGVRVPARAIFSSMVLKQLAALGSTHISARLDAVAELVRQPEEARSALTAALIDPRTPALICVWAMIAIGQLQPDEDQKRALVDCLKSRDAIVRRCAVEMLGSLNVAWAVPDIATLLSDHEPIDSAWFDDDATPSRAAIRALERLASPDAKALLAALRDT